MVMNALVGDESTIPRQQVVVELPAVNDRCPNCQDVFGKHYLTADGKTFGCSAKTAVQGGRGKYYACPCPGFSVQIKWAIDHRIVLTGDPEEALRAAEERMEELGYKKEG